MDLFAVLAGIATLGFMAGLLCGLGIAHDGQTVRAYMDDDR